MICEFQRLDPRVCRIVAFTKLTENLRLSMQDVVDNELVGTEMSLVADFS
jgi:hypothetical protein